MQCRKDSCGCDHPASDPFSCVPLGACSVRGEIIYCQCKPGYAGDRCERCADGKIDYPQCIDPKHRDEESAEQQLLDEEAKKKKNDVADSKKDDDENVQLKAGDANTQQQQSSPLDAVSNTVNSAKAKIASVNTSAMLGVGCIVVLVLAAACFAVRYRGARKRYGKYRRMAMLQDDDDDDGDEMNILSL